MARTETMGASRARRRRVWVYVVAGLAAGALIIYVFVFSRHGYLRLRELQRENNRLTAELADLKRENAALREEMTRLDDPAAAEKLAREELGLVKEGETIYRFVDPPDKKKSPQP